MNCSRFRFLIQQKFDLDLAPQEERIVLAHLESCESCAKFYHQLQQVILAAEEAPLPDEMLPPNEEQLARMIMSQLPATKSSPFAFITNLFQKKDAPPPMEDSRVRRGPAGKQATAAAGGERGSAFPHRSSSAVKDAGRGSSDTNSKFKNPKEEEFSGASNRLKQMNKGFDPEAEQRELQSTTLGAKFGKAVPVAAPIESPLTLAESIRKKISEGAKAPEDGSGEDYDDENGADNGQENYDDGFDNSNEQAARQPGPSPQGLQGFNQGMMQQPMGQGGNPNAMPQMAQPQGFNSAPAAPVGAPAFGAPAANANAPVVGSWGKPSTTDSSGGWQQGGGASGGMQQAVPAQQMMPPQPYLAEQPAQAAPQAPAQPGQPAGWGSTWDNAAAPQAPAPQVNAQPQGGNWGAPAPATNNWNQAPAAQPPAVQAMQPQASPPAWGAPAPAQAVPQAPAPAAFDATPAQSNPGWGQAPAQAPAPAAVAQVAPAAAAPTGGWGNGSSDSWDAGGQKGWGQTGADIPKPAAPAAPAAVQPDAQPAPQVDSWGQPVAQAAWGQTAGSVNTTATSAPQPAAEPTQGGWGSTNPQGGWGTPAEANNWNAPKPSQVDAQAPAPAAAQPAPAARPAGRPAWSLESEQIETGTWQAFSPSGESLGAKSAPAPAKKAEEPLSADPLSIDDRWSTPIQSRKNTEPEQPGPATPQPIPQQGFAPPMMPPPMPAPGGMEYPNYSPDALKEAEPAWGEPAAAAQQAPVAPQPQQSLQQSVMQKLNNTLDESAGGQAAGQQNSWELSIQEKLQQQQRALMGASMQQLSALPVPPSLQDITPAPIPAPAQNTQTNGWNAQPQANDWSANQNIVQPAAQEPQWGAPAAPPQQFEAQPSMQQSFQTAPAAPQPEQKSSLFSLDDQAIDQLFNENLKLKNAGTQAPQRTQSAEQPAAMAAPAPAMAAPAPAPAWTPAPTTWAPEPQQLAPAPVPAPAPAPAQYAQPQPQQQQPQHGHPQMDWGENNNAAQPKITGVNARPSMPNAPYNPAEDRRGQTNADQYAPPAMPQQAPAPVPAAPAQNQNQQQGLFNLDDNAMDQLFQSNLGVEEAARSVGGNAAQPATMPAQMPAQMPQPAMQSGSTSGGWAQPPATPTSSGSGWASPPQNQQPAPFAQAPQQQAPFAPPQQPQEQPAPAPVANPGWGAPQQPALPPQTPAPVQQPQQQQPQQQPAQGGWGGQAAASGTGWGQQQQPAAPQPRIGAPSDPSKPKTGLFAIDDSVIDSIFADNLGVKDGQGPRGNVNEAVAKLTDAVSQQPAAPAGYGDANYDSPAPVKVEGVGRLDSRVDNTADQNSGRIASIGKFLLDQKDLEKIGNITEADLSDSSMRILTQDAASELQQLLQHIGQQKSVIGSVIIGHDGLLIANTLPPDFDAESMGQFALGIYMNTSTTVTKLGHEHIHQFVGRTPRGYIVIADFGGGLLVTISEGSETDMLIPLMRSITQLVAQ